MIWYYVFDGTDVVFISSVYEEARDVLLTSKSYILLEGIEPSI